MYAPFRTFASYALAIFVTGCTMRSDENPKHEELTVPAQEQTDVEHDTARTKHELGELEQRIKMVDWCTEVLLRRPKEVPRMRYSAEPRVMCKQMCIAMDEQYACGLDGRAGI